MIGRITDLGHMYEYLSLFSKFYAFFPKPEYWGKIISERNLDYAFALRNAQPEESDVVLDIGCACSYFVNCLAEFADKVYGIDLIESEHVAYTKPWLETMKEYTDFQTGKIEIIEGNAAKLPFPDAYFDKVYTFSALEHFTGADDSLCCAEVHRVLKPGGIFIGSVDYNPMTEWPRGEDSPVRTYTYQSFMDRVFVPSKLNLVGGDFIKAVPIPSTFDMVCIGLFFILKKVLT